MKKVLIILSSAAMFCFVTVSEAQVSDTASLNFNNQSTVKDKDEQAPAKEDDSGIDNSRVGSSSGVREGSISSEDQAQQLPKPTEEQTDQKTTTGGQPASGREKNRPKREKSSLKNGNSYYEDESGKKVKSKKSKAKEKADTD